MNKLEVEMYVRTKSGIAKIEELAEGYDYDFIIDTALNLKWTNGGFLFKEDVEKASYNIINLIEVGDYVNGLLVIDKYYDYANKEWRLNDRDGLICIENNIKSIVTKEQFSSMEYRLGE